MAAGHSCAPLRLGKAQALPDRPPCQEASEDFFGGQELRSGYALPPFLAAAIPRLTLIDAPVSACLSRRRLRFLVLNTLARLICHARERVLRFADTFARSVLDRFRVRIRARPPPLAA